MASAASPRPARRPAPVNFLEALKDLGRDAASQAKIHISQAVTQDIPESFGLSGDLTPNQSYSLEDLKHAEKTGEARAEARFGNRLQQERLVFLQSESQTKAQITAIQAEIKSLAKSVGSFAREVEIATFQAPVNPGVYHKNFFDALRSFINSIRQRVDQSRNWLATTNARATQRNYYWGQVKSSGTKFMLSSERYMVTSTG